MPPRNRPASGGLSLRSELLARVRGEQTLRRMRRAGLNAPGELFLAHGVNVDLMFAWAITIGAGTRIAHDVRIIAHDAAVKHLTGYTEVLPVVIGEGCYIGAGTLVLPGSRIGDETVIGAGSIVRGELPAGVVAVGNPARAIAQANELRDRHAALQGTLTCVDKRPVDHLTAPELRALQDGLARDGRVYVR
jgi:hypothetical protein